MEEFKQKIKTESTSVGATKVAQILLKRKTSTQWE